MLTVHWNLEDPLSLTTRDPVSSLEKPIVIDSDSSGVVSAAIIFNS